MTETIVQFMRHVQKYGTAGQATDDSIIRRMRSACWITKATNTHTQYTLRIVYKDGGNGYAKAPQFYVTHTIPVLFTLNLVVYKIKIGLRTAGGFTFRN